jgi:enterochelin esterase-like enzyme
MPVHRFAVATTLLFALLISSRIAKSAEAQAEPQSPQLRALASELSTSPAASDAFWAGLSGTKYPLIEDIPGRPHDALYTFLWHAEPGQEALNVLFNGWFPLHAAKGFDSFTRLGQSNLWYTSYVFPRTAHLRYELIAPKGWHASPDRATYFAMDGREYETFHDPLNPRLNDWNNALVSYAEGPDAKTSPYLTKRAATPAGTLEELDIDSKILGNRRTLQVYLPPGYRHDSRSYGLLLAFDGIQYTTAIPTPAILDNMIAAHAIPPVIAVFLESPDRDSEFPPNDSFQSFISTELLPLLRAHYKLSRDPRRSAVLGSSYGGIAAAYTAFNFPDLFGNVISQSGSYGWAPPGATPPPVPPPPQPTPRGPGADTGWLIKRIAESPAKKIRFYLDAGIWEGNTLLLSNRLLQSVLIGKGYDVVYVEGDGTHHAYYWMLRLPGGLQNALGFSHRAPQ